MTPWTVTHQATLSMEFSRQEYWSGLPFSPPEALPNPGIERGSPALQANSLCRQVSVNLSLSTEPVKGVHPIPSSHSMAPAPHLEDHILCG